MRRLCGLLLFCLALPGCGSGGSGGAASLPLVIVVQDGSFPDALAVVSPAVLGLSLALSRAPSAAAVRVIDVTRADGVEAMSPSAVAIAPFTEVADAVVRRWVEAGVLVVGLSELGSTPVADAPTTGMWRRFVAPLRDHAAALADAAGPQRPICVGGDDTAWSGALTDALRSTAGDLRLVDPGAAVTGSCASVVWTGSARDAASMRIGLDGAGGAQVPLILNDAARTQGYLDAVASSTPRPDVGVCACAELAGGPITPAARAFVHDYGATNGLVPGPFAVEGFDAGAWLSAVLGGAAPGGAMTDGIAGPYRWDGTGELADVPERCARASGVRWIVVNEVGGRC